MDSNNSNEGVILIRTKIPYENDVEKEKENIIRPQDQNVHQLQNKNNHEETFIHEIKVFIIQTETQIASFSIKSLLVSNIFIIFL